MVRDTFRLMSHQLMIDFCQELESNMVPTADREKDQHLELQVQRHDFCDSGNGGSTSINTNAT